MGSIQLDTISEFDAVEVTEAMIEEAVTNIAMEVVQKARASQTLPEHASS